MLTSFKAFIDNLITEELHPAIKDIVTSPQLPYKSKQALIAKKIKQLTTSGEHTGIEGNMPKGSARAYLKHSEPHEIHLDGKKQHIPVGTKVAIKSSLDKFHKGHTPLGNMQNEAEHGDHYINKKYRILSHDSDTGHYHTNTEHGIFPPLISHDPHHEWNQVGHARNIKPGEFRKITKTKEHPNGISHTEFSDALNREHRRALGIHREHSAEKEAKLDKVDKHPLVKKFKEYHNETANPPYDLGMKNNLGVFEHPNGSHHIVARDHGFNSDVEHAYLHARKAENEAWLHKPRHY